MIITDKFVWYHLPKTAGTRTRRHLELFYRSDIIHNSCGLNMPIEEREAHKNHIDSTKNGKDLDWIINFRKLPFWLMSKTNHVSRQHYANNTVLYEKITRMGALELLKNGMALNMHGSKDCGDDYIKNFQHVFDRLAPTVPGRTIIIRQEDFVDDFKKLFDLYPSSHSLKDVHNANLLPFPVHSYFNLEKHKRDPQVITEAGLNHFLSEKTNFHPSHPANKIDLKDIYSLTDKELTDMYANNPQWAKLEQQLYPSFPEFLQ